MESRVRLLENQFRNAKDKVQAYHLSSILYDIDPIKYKNDFINSVLNNWRFVETHDVEKLLAIWDTFEKNPNNDANLINLHFILRNTDKVQELTNQFILDYPDDASGYLLESRNILVRGDREEIMAYAEFLKTVYDKVDKKDYIGLQISSMLLMYNIDDMAAWEYYDKRLGIYEAYANYWRPDLETTIAGKKILVIMEQGFGDNFQSLLFLKYLKENGARLVTILCRTKSIGPLLKHVSGHDLILDIDGVEQATLGQYPFSDYDLMIPGMSLPHRVAKALKTRVSYLIPRTPCITGVTPRSIPAEVGFVWQGNPEFGNDRNRSVGWDFMKHIVRDFKKAGVKCVSLQKDFINDEIPTVALGADWLATAQVLAGLKLLVSTDTGIVHCASAMGVPTVMPVSVSGDWRWGNSGDTCPWYSSLIIYRQKNFGDWESETALFFARCYQKYLMIGAPGPMC